LNHCAIEPLLNFGFLNYQLPDYEITQLPDFAVTNIKFPLLLCLCVATASLIG